MTTTLTRNDAIEEITPYLTTMVTRVSMGRGLDEQTEQDLLQDVLLACLEAHERFDDTQDKAYRSYMHDVAQYTITAFVWRRLDSVVPLPERLGKQMAQVRIARAKLTQELQRMPRNREVAEAMGISLEDLETIRAKAEYEQDYLEDMNSGDDGEAALTDDYVGWEETLTATGYEPEPTVNHVNIMAEVMLMLEQLHPEEKEAVILTFGLGNGPALTLRDAAAKMNVSRTQVGRLADKGVRKLRGRLMLKGVDMGGMQ